MVWTPSGVQTCFAKKTIQQLTNLQAGDHIEWEIAGKQAIITKLYPRKNALIRPYISNLEQLVIMLTSVPQPDLMLVDKLLIGCKIYGIEPMIVVNKSDVLQPGFYDDLLCQYGHAVKSILLTSAKTKEGLSGLKEKLQGKLTAFCGQSGVGKSSIISALFGVDLKTDALSLKSSRGKNTTRETEIFVFEQNTLVADTPGFSMLHYDDFDPSHLKGYYDEFEPFARLCLYSNCNHVKESVKECGVKQAVLENKINTKRFERYQILYEKLNEIWRKKYD